MQKETKGKKRSAGLFLWQRVLSRLTGLPSLTPRLSPTDLPRFSQYIELLSTSDDAGGWSLPVGSRGERWTEQTSPLSVAILRTSKRVYNEAVGYLYSENTLHLSDPFYLAETILPTLGAEKLRLLQYASFAWPEWEEYYPHPDGDGEGEGEGGGTFGAVGLLVQHCPNLKEIEFEDAGLRGSNLPGGVDQLLDAFYLFNSYLQAVPSLKKITVHVNQHERWRRYFDGYWDDEQRVIEVMRNAGWLLQARAYYRWQ